MALTDNLVSYWKLDEVSGNASDSVGSNTLTNQNTVTYSGTSGKINNYADGGSSNTNKRLDRADALGMNIGSEYSFSFWANVTTAPATNTTVFLFRQSMGSTSPYIDMSCRYADTGGTKSLKFYRRKVEVANEIATYDVTLTPGTWYHIAGTYDTTNLRLYISNVQSTPVATQAASGNGISIADNNLFAILDDQQNNGPFSGKMDEVGIWSRAITEAEVTSLYNGGAGLQYPFGGGGAVIIAPTLLTLNVG